MGEFWLTDEQFAKIVPHLPTDTRGKERVDDRRVISGIIHVLKSGGRWTDAPREIYGPKKTLYNRFVRWAAKGIWRDLFETLARAGGPPSQVLIDSVRAARPAAAFPGGRSQCRRQRRAVLALFPARARFPSVPSRLPALLAASDGSDRPVVGWGRDEG